MKNEFCNTIGPLADVREPLFDVLMQIAGNLPRRRVGGTPQFESTDIAVGFGGAIAKRAPKPT
jgi:hypothetical protein